MGKQPIDLRNRVVHNSAEPPQKPSRPDPSGLRTPPPAGAPSKNMPMNLAPGQVLKGSSGQPALTPMEMAALENTGWQPGQPVPSSIPPEIAAAAMAIQQEATKPLPFAGMKPVETVDISQVSPEKQAEVRQAVNEMLRHHATQANPVPSAPAPVRRPPNLAGVLQQPPAAEKQALPPEPVDIASQAIPGWHAPGQPYVPPTVPNPVAYPDLRKQPEPAPSPGPQEVDPLRGIDLSNLGPGDQTLVVELPSSRNETPEPIVVEPTQEESLTAAGPSLTHCPHCSWELSTPDIAEPDYMEKQSFLQSILGQKPFTKEYTLLGGALKVRFRTLTTREVDTIYKQVLLERERGLIATVEDYWEKINRYRLYLQISQVFTVEFRHDLPDGYDKETNPNAEAHWQFDTPDDPRETGLPVIEEYFLSQILRTEVLQRIVNNQCAMFNRLVAKLEALVDNSDFWQPTGAPS